jgi:hypothetical protein
MHSWQPGNMKFFCLEEGHRRLEKEHLCLERLPAYSWRWSTDGASNDKNL